MSARSQLNNPLNLLLVGLPGKLATVIAEGVAAGQDLNLLDFAFCSSNCQRSSLPVANQSIKLVQPVDWESALVDLEGLARTIVIDCTVPAAVPDNVSFYRKNQLNFILATSGYKQADIEGLLITDRASWQGNALFAPNLAKPIVLLQALLEYGATRFPGALSDLEMQITESHQSSKRDVSGTALWMLERFNKLGANLTPGSQINSVRDAAAQEELGVPAQFIDGHAWHSYRFKTKGAVPAFAATLEHNVNGRELYAAGAISAAKFLFSKVLAGSRGEIFSMIDVLENEGAK